MFQEIWKEDPLICSECQNETKNISFITDIDKVGKIFRCLYLWQDKEQDSQLRTSRDPPVLIEEIVCTLADDGWHREMDNLVSLISRIHFSTKGEVCLSLYKYSLSLRTYWGFLNLFPRFNLNFGAQIQIVLRFLQNLYQYRGMRKPSFCHLICQFSICQLCIASPYYLTW